VGACSGLPATRCSPWDFDPSPTLRGARFTWKIRNSGGVIVENGEELNGPLQPGYAFAMEDVVQDCTTGKLAGR
jgi:hypothetical protein